MADTGIIAMGKWLQAQGCTVSENPAFGGVCTNGCHATNSNHYKGRAIDVNADSAPGGEAAKLNRLYDFLISQRSQLGIIELFFQNRGYPTPVADHQDHMHVAIAGPPTKTMQQLANVKPGAFPKGKTEGIGEALSEVPGDAAGALTGAAADTAKAIVGLLFDSIGKDGARILLYVALVIGGGGLALYGVSRALGVDAPAMAALKVMPK